MRGMRPARLLVPIFAANTPRQLRFTLAALNAGVYGLMLQNVAWLQNYPETPNLYDAGVIYKPELRRVSVGRVLEYGEDWQSIPWVLYKRHGDCEDLGAWRAAELVVRYRIPAKPDVAMRQLPSGHWRAHVRVKWPNGQIEDPSARLGMYAYAGAFDDPAKVDAVARALLARQRAGGSIAFSRGQRVAEY